MTNSFLDELREIREQVEAHAVKEMPVPPDGRFVVRLKPPPDYRKRLTDIVAVYRVGSALTAEQELQLLVDCCDEILRRDPDTRELVSIEGGPLQFDAGDERWGDDVQTARECVAKLYNLDAQPLALAGIADAVVDWLQGIDAEIATRAEGKSPNGTAASASAPRRTSN